MTGKYWDDTTTTYGDTGRLYDAAPADFDTNRLEWRFEVAWLGGTKYFCESSGRSEADRVVGCYWYRGRSDFIDPGGKGRARYEPGRMVITLVNDDGRYDQANTSSPLYGYITPKKLCRLGVRMASSTDYSYNTSYKWRFTGVLLGVRNYQNELGEKFSDFTVGCGWQWLQSHTLYLGTLWSETIADFIERVALKLQWPWAWHAGASETLPYLWAAGEDGQKVLSNVGDAVAGHLWLDGMGNIRYEKRTVVPTLAAALTQSDVLRDIPTTNPWDNQWNVVKVNYSTPNRAQTGKCMVGWGEKGLYVTVTASSWTNYWDTILGFKNADQEISIAAGESVTLSGTYAMDLDTSWTNLLGVDEGFPRSSRLIALIPTSAGTGDSIRRCEFGHDFWSGTGATGRNVSGYVDVSFEDGTTAFQAVLTNNYSGTVYSRVRTVTGDALATANVGETVTDDRSAGEGKKILNISSPYAILDSTNYPIATASAIAAFYADMLQASPVLPTITIESRPDVQFLDIMDWVLFEADKIGLLDDFYVGRLEETWLTPNGQAVRTVVKMEPETIVSGFVTLENGGFVTLENGGYIALG